MRTRSFSIRWHLAAVSLLAVVPLLALGSYFIDRLARIERAQFEETARQASRQAADLLDREMQGIKAAMITLQTSPALLSDDLAVFHVQARAVVASFPGALISLRRPNGEIIMSTIRPELEPPGQMSSAEIIATDQRAIQTRSTVVSDLYTGVITNRLFTSIATPVFRDGVALYILSLTLTPERILEVISLVQIDPSWSIGVTGRNGRVIARTRDHDRYVGSQATPTFRNSTIGQRGLFEGRNLEGNAVLVSYDRSSATGWVISAAVPQAALEQPILRSQRIIASLTLVSLMLSALLATGYGYFVTVPIRQLQRDADAVGAGREVHAFRTGIRELDDVASGLGQASTDLRKRDRQQFLLINELNHRVKNTLAIIQSLMRRTARQSATVKDLERALEGRLLALAASHDALTASNWQGANLRHLVDLALKIFSHDGERVQMTGPEVHLSNRGSVAFAMVLHELCTNAAKYGALSAPGGSVAVAWSEDAETLHFDWRERGGPAVAEPSRRGFGSELIRACVQHDLDGQCSFHYESAGFRFEAGLPKREAVHEAGREEFHG